MGSVIDDRGIPASPSGRYCDKSQQFNKILTKVPEELYHILGEITHSSPAFSGFGAFGSYVIGLIYSLLPVSNVMQNKNKTYFFFACIRENKTLNLHQKSHL